MNLPDLYYLAWSATTSANTQLPPESDAFQDFLADETKAVEMELLSIRGAGVISTVEQQRWRVRVAIIRATNYLCAHWRGTCRDCGVETNNTNSASLSRVVCDKCAFKKVPTPQKGELYDRMGDVFPMMTIRPLTIAAMTDDQRREVGQWLDAILREKPIPATPSAIAPYLNMLGVTLSGLDLRTPAEDES